MVHAVKLGVTKFSCFVDLIGTVFSTYITQKHVMLKWDTHCNCGTHVDTVQSLSSVANMVMLEVSQFFMASESAKSDKLYSSDKRRTLYEFCIYEF